MKKIILFTRITDDTEWNAWVEVMKTENITLQNNELEYQRNDVKLRVKNGKNLLGNIPSLPPRGQPNGNIISQASNFIKKLWEQIKNEKGPEVIIAIHFGGGGGFDERVKPWLEYFQRTNYNNDNDLRNAVEGILNNFNQQDKPILKEYSIGSYNEEDIKSWIRENLNDLIKLYEYLKKNIIKDFSLLKHRITNSFLDLDIDWQGLKQVSEKDKNKAKKYLNAVLNKNVSNYYKQKLVNLWFYLTGNKNNNLKINKTKTSLDKKQLPSEKSILDLINELDNEKKNAIKEQWCVLLNHVGLKVNNDPFNVSNISVDDESNIVKYLKNLDEMIQDQSKRDINKFLGKIEKEIEGGQKEITYFNFHHWYLKLGDLLESLKIFLE